MKRTSSSRRFDRIFLVTPFLPLILVGTILGLPPESLLGADIPLPEHPRPDFQRSEWLNLNGQWAFRFDRENSGEKENWQAGSLQSFPGAIQVPFPWGSELSGVADEADIGWYARTVQVPEAWKGKRVFLCIGASDWVTTGWLGGNHVGRHRGGYTPFEFELTQHMTPGRDQLLVQRVDDSPHRFKLEGKQGYGPARGIWQTVYLEARGPVYLETIQFHPDIDTKTVEIRAEISKEAPADLNLKLRFTTGDLPEAVLPVPEGKSETSLVVKIPRPRLWSLEDPFLYEVAALLQGNDGPQDRVSTYFGMRKVSVSRLPGTDFPYITLNNEPLYLQMALDQAYHPEGFYTFPSDSFMKDEILRSRRIGLNALRVHVKIEIPRKLYWADRLGLLIMEDVPNSWGEPDAEMRFEIETALRGMIRRDFNHPSIFSWVIFNETWGLKTKGKGYTLETQKWVEAMYRLAKELDPTRLVEDNSPCNHDHVVTDINSWHAYLPGYAWKERLDQICRDTFPGSKWNFIGGRTQENEPLLNSECGNVWGYEGSTGDVDWSYDYHRMMNEFRRHPEICGWLYTEHHDVINEWNGYFRYDRSGKITGLGALVPGMSLRDLHCSFYIAPGVDVCMDVKPGQLVEVPLWASFMTGTAPANELILRMTLFSWDGLGNRAYMTRQSQRIEFAPWMSKELPAVELIMPEERSLAILILSLEDPTGRILHRNFTTFLVSEGPAPRDEETTLEGKKARIIRFGPGSYGKGEWSLGTWDVLDGLKVNGAGTGYFEYRLPWPEGLDPSEIVSASFRAELSAKQLFTKDKKHAPKQGGDFMRGKGTHDPSLNPNSYPMTDTVRFPSAVRVRLAGIALGIHDLHDDPADHRGILSWHSQKRDRKLREAGSYGYLVTETVSREALQAAAAAKEIILRLEVDPSLPGGLAIYGASFGRYPLDPTLIFLLKGEKN